jgi:hypothetical protein
MILKNKKMWAILINFFVPLSLQTSGTIVAPPNGPIKKFVFQNLNI